MASIDDARLNSPHPEERSEGPRLEGHGVIAREAVRHRVAEKRLLPGGATVTMVW